MGAVLREWMRSGYGNLRQSRSLSLPTSPFFGFLGIHDIPVNFGRYGRRPGNFTHSDRPRGETEFRRKALSPGPDGRPRWEFPTTWLTGRPDGYWKSIAIPKMVEMISRAAWRSVLRMSPKIPRAAGDYGPPRPVQRDEKSTRDMYPAGLPLIPEANILESNAHHKSTETGEYIGCNFASHSGCGIRKSLVCGGVAG